MFLTRDGEIAELKGRLGDLERVVEKQKNKIAALERDASLVIYPNDVAKSLGCPYEEVSMKSVVYGLLQHLGLQIKVSPAKDKEVRLLQSAVSNKGE